MKKKANYFLKNYRLNMIQNNSLKLWSKNLCSRQGSHRVGCDQRFYDLMRTLVQEYVISTRVLLYAFLVYHFSLFEVKIWEGGVKKVSEFVYKNRRNLTSIIIAQHVGGNPKTCFAYMLKIQTSKVILDPQRKKCFRKILEASCKA